MKLEEVIDQKVNHIFKKNPLLSNDLTLYFHSAIFSLIFYVIIFLYYILTGENYSVRILNKSIADTSFFVIGVSLALASICYFFNFADKFIIYRKHLGVVGFFLLFFHVLISIFHPIYGPFDMYYLNSQQFPSFASAIVATYIFSVMAIISNKTAIQKFGPKLWRFILRFGFIAYGLALYHFAVKNTDIFTRYLTSSEFILPPMSLMAFVFGCGVLLLRLLLFIKIKR